MTVREAGDDNDSEEELANNIKLAGKIYQIKKLQKRSLKIASSI